MSYTVEVKVKRLTENAEIPVKATEGASFFDVFSTQTINLGPGTITKIGTGLAFEVPEDNEMEIRPRSGLAVKGITISNSPGTLDSDYRGELTILLINHSRNWILIEEGDRIAQIGVRPIPRVFFTEVGELSPTKRGKKGFGSTGR